MNSVAQPKGTRDGTRGVRGRVVYSCRCSSPLCRRHEGMFLKRDKARRVAKRMEEEYCEVTIVEWRLS
jgi:hypothetical protein